MKFIQLLKQYKDWVVYAFCIWCFIAIFRSEHTEIILQFLGKGLGFAAVVGLIFFLMDLFFFGKKKRKQQP